jgi:hypothetical protein
LTWKGSFLTLSQRFGGCHEQHQKVGKGHQNMANPPTVG